MNNTISFNTFQKKHKYILCIDSDGTVMDGMNVKHKKCFGPCFVKEFGLESRAEEVLESWNQVNLHGLTRARNRFITVLMLLQKYQSELDLNLAPLEEWVAYTGTLSQTSLQKEIDKTNEPVLKKVLHWSQQCNETIGKLTFDDIQPFAGAGEFFKAFHRKVDLAVVSSANIRALTNEWSHFGLYDYMSLMTSQEDGTKTECLQKIISYGYKPDHVLMVGDAIVDLETAQKCGTFFYPIVPDQEEESWKSLRETYMQFFLDNAYATCQEKLIDDFKKA